MRNLHLKHYLKMHVSSLADTDIKHELSTEKHYCICDFLHRMSVYFHTIPLHLITPEEQSLLNTLFAF